MYDTSNEEITITDIFVITPEDDQPGLSVNDREFLKIMNSECYRDENGSWTAPFQFKKDRKRLPNNREQVMKRTLSFLASCKKNPLKMEHSISFMEKVFCFIARRCVQEKRDCDPRVTEFVNRNFYVDEGLVT